MINKLPQSGPYPGLLPIIRRERKNRRIEAATVEKPADIAPTSTKASEDGGGNGVKCDVAAAEALTDPDQVLVNEARVVPELVATPPADLTGTNGGGAAVVVESKDGTTPGGATGPTAPAEVEESATMVNPGKAKKNGKKAKS